MSGNPQIVEQANVLAPPSDTPAKPNIDDEIIDLDAGDSLLDGQPDDGADTTGDETPPSKKTEETKSGESDETIGDEEVGEEDADIAALKAEPEKAAKPSGSARLKAKLAEAQAEIERLRQAAPKPDVAAELAAAVEREIGPPPKEEDFSDWSEFQTARYGYEADRRAVTREIRKNAEAAQRSLNERNVQIVETFKERAEEVRSLVKDFDAVIGAATISPQNGEVALAILESEKGPHIAYYLSKHPDKVNEINAMTLRRALAEIGRLEAKLTTPPKKETKAPAPVPAVRGGTKTEEVDPEKLSMDDFAKWYDQRKSARG